LLNDEETAVPNIVDTILPTTMIGSYPKPRWYSRYNLAGADLLEWWKLEENWHAWWDATTACIKDQELAGLDIVTDGQMHFDDYGGVRLVLVRASRGLHQGQTAQPAGHRHRGQ
jgi:5-methyltetrahydropteroyltriglutamate--homocysteine methyltransferase